MGVKLTKVVRTAPQKTGETSAPHTKPAAAQTQQPAADMDMIQAAINEALKSQTDAIREASEAAANAAVEAVQTAVTKDKAAEIAVPKVMNEVAAQKLEDNLRKYIGSDIRIHTADKESTAGKLEMVEDGWIKITNARSAGAAYYIDEDIVNIRNIVRVRFTKVITKEEYRVFMNLDAPNDANA